MNADAGSVFAISILAVLAVLAFAPRRKGPKAPAPSQPQPASVTDEAGLARNVGGVTGLMGGSVEDAAVTKYALSRLDHPPTTYDIGVAAGIESTKRPD